MAMNTLGPVEKCTKCTIVLNESFRDDTNDRCEADGEPRARLSFAERLLPNTQDLQSQSGYILAVESHVIFASSWAG